MLVSNIGNCWQGSGVQIMLTISRRTLYICCSPLNCCYQMWSINKSQKNTSRSRTQLLLAWNYPVSVSFRASHFNTTSHWTVRFNVALQHPSSRKRNNWHYATDFTVMMWWHYQDLPMGGCVHLWERAEHMNRSWESTSPYRAWLRPLELSFLSSLS